MLTFPVIDMVAILGIGSVKDFLDLGFTIQRNETVTPQALLFGTSLVNNLTLKLLAAWVDLLSSSNVPLYTATTFGLGQIHQPQIHRGK